MCECSGKSVLHDSLDNRVRLAEIFEAQSILCAKILDKIGVSYDSVCSARNEELTCQWIRNYNDAFMSEVAELMEAGTNAYPFISPAVKLEAVDCLHFLVSLSQIVGLSSDDIVTDEDVRSTESLRSFIAAFVLPSNELRAATPWKWWATGQSFSVEKARDAVEFMWHLFASMCFVLGMSSRDLHKIYFMKNAANHARQDDGYSIATKTEDDNIAIEESL